MGAVVAFGSEGVALSRARPVDVHAVGRAALVRDAVHVLPVVAEVRVAARVGAGGGERSLLVTEEAEGSFEL
jgi:hypothetical protein